MVRPQFGADLLLAALVHRNINCVFGYPGGAIMPVYDALTRSPLRHILARHEQGAAFAAIGYARAARKLGVCLVTSGPGATNTVTAIADAHLDSVPLLVICGQVATPVMGTDAFQEVDIVGITLPIVKHSFCVRRIEDLAHTVHAACTLALHGRPGPVLIDLPKDVQQAHVPEGLVAQPAFPPAVADATIAAAATALAAASASIAAAARPVLYVGGGVAAAHAEDALRAFVARTEMPTVTTLKGLGCLPSAARENLGMLGMHGGKAANLAVQQSDLLVVVGARFDDRATGNLSRFAPRARVVHLDIDAAEVSKLRAADVCVVGDLAASLRHLTDGCAAPLAIEAWRRRCAELKAAHAWRYDAPGDGVYGPAFVRDLTQAAGTRLVLTTDVGQHQMWVAQHAALQHARMLHTSGGLGTMGFGLPAAIGAQLADPAALVVNVTGDGSFMMNIQELATVRRYGLPVRIVVFDNQRLGMVRQWQELFFAERYSETSLHDNPDFVALAEAFGIPAFAVRTRADVPRAIERILQEPGPLLVHVHIDPRQNVWPLVPPGHGNDSMLDGST